MPLTFRSLSDESLSGKVFPHSRPQNISLLRHMMSTTINMCDSQIEFYCCHGLRNQLPGHLYVYIWAEANVQAEMLARTVGIRVPDLQHDIGAK